MVLTILNFIFWRLVFNLSASHSVICELILFFDWMNSISIYTIGGMGFAIWNHMLDTMLMVITKNQPTYCNLFRIRSLMYLLLLFGVQFPRYGPLKSYIGCLCQWLLLHLPSYCNYFRKFRFLMNLLFLSDALVFKSCGGLLQACRNRLYFFVYGSCVWFLHLELYCKLASDMVYYM